MIKKLIDIHKNFRTDKGTRHNYIEVYDSLFSQIHGSVKNILEIGTLFGGSLKLWNEYFDHATIYGVEDFSQKEGFGQLVDKELIIKDLSSYERIKLKVFDSSNGELVKSNLGHVKFDVIIDDASHSLLNQVANINNFFDLLSDTGIYIIEDIQSINDSEALSAFIGSKTNKKCQIVELNTQYISDDRLLILDKRNV